MKTSQKTPPPPEQDKYIQGHVPGVSKFIFRLQFHSTQAKKMYLCLLQKA